ncbi:putative Zinc finger, SWIM-type [Helianthus debilis subsp. tardiflorus]
MLLNNMCEVYNGKIVEGRDKPIISALEYIREYLMRRIVTVLNVIDKSEGLLTPWATEQFEIIKKEATFYHVQWNRGEFYEVSGKPNHARVVNLEKRTCSCRRWEITGMPCRHAVAALWEMGVTGGRVGALESWVYPVYKLERWKLVYSHKINPINGRSMWVKVQCPITITPPKHHTPVGRPKKARKRSAVEMEDLALTRKLTRKNTKGKCTKCGANGNNIRTCKGAQA